MTTVTEDVPVEVVPPRYQMPKVGLGETVVFYRDGKLTTGQGEAGIVVKVHSTARAVDVRLLASGVAFYAVRHHTDPRLEESEEIRKGGCWEFGEIKLAVLQLQEEMRELKAVAKKAK